MTSRGTEGISEAARVGCFITMMSNIILHTRLINDINSIAYTDVRFINNINSSISLKDNSCERQRVRERGNDSARRTRARERER